MGTWATGLYADDEAQDARDAYREILDQGLDGKAATDRFLKDWKGAMKDSDDGPVIWLALAETQWKLGRLEDRVRDKAIEIIDSGASLKLWREQSEGLAAKRQKVLLALKEQLLSPQPTAKPIKVKKPTKIANWKPGELFAYRLKSGKLVVLCLESVDEGHHAILSALDWTGETVPDQKTLQARPRKRLKDRKSTTMMVMAWKKSDVPYDRMTRLDCRVNVISKPIRNGKDESWKRLDEALERQYGWS